MMQSKCPQQSRADRAPSRCWARCAARPRYDVWQISAMTETCKSPVLSALIWMSVQRIQVEGLSVGRGFRAVEVLWAGVTLWLRHWQSAQKAICWRDMSGGWRISLCLCEFSFLSESLLDRLQGKRGGKQPIDPMEATCKGHHTENQNPFIALVRVTSNSSRCEPQIPQLSLPKQPMWRG